MRDKFNDTASTDKEKEGGKKSKLIMTSMQNAKIMPNKILMMMTMMRTLTLRTMTMMTMMIMMKMKAMIIMMMAVMMMMIMIMISTEEKRALKKMTTNREIRSSYMRSTMITM